MSNRRKNWSINPARIILRMNGESASYSIFGYVIETEYSDGTPCIQLQPADRRRNPVLTVPKEDVESIICNY